MLKQLGGRLSSRSLAKSPRHISYPRLFAPSCLQRLPTLPPFSKAEARSLVTTTQETDSLDEVSHELFNCTKYRFLYNEKYRLAQRRTPFDISEFKALAAGSVNQKPEDVVGFEKLSDGHMNRVFLITMRDGFKLIGRIPYSFLEPSSLKIASGVATLDFLRLHGLPVPQVFGYSPTPNNAARTAYVFTQLMPGKNLNKIWDAGSMPQEAKIEVVKSIVELESRILGLKFPACGSLYYSKDVEYGVQVDYTNPQARGSFCIGPDTDWALWWGKRLGLAVDRGPYLTPEAAISAGAKKEIAYLEEFGRPLHPWNREYRDLYDHQKQSPQDFRNLLQSYLKVAPYLIPRGSSTRPALRHARLSLENIMVSAELEVTGVINWQNCPIRPLFVQSGIPSELHCREYLEADNIKAPRLPADYHLSSAGDEDNLNQIRQIHHAYITATEELNPEHMAIMKVPGNDVRRKIVFASEGVWRGDLFELEHALMHMSKVWDDLSDKAADAPKVFPLNITDEAWQQNWAMFKDRLEEESAMSLLCGLLGMAGTDGFVAPEHYDIVKEAAAGFRACAVKDAAAESEEELKNTEEHWFFDDFDEEEYQ